MKKTISTILAIAMLSSFSTNVFANEMTSRELTPTVKINKTTEDDYFKNCKKEYHLLKNSKIEKIVLSFWNIGSNKKLGPFHTLVLDAATTKIVTNLIQSHLSMPDKWLARRKVSPLRIPNRSSFIVHIKNKEPIDLGLSRLLSTQAIGHCYFTMDEQALKELRLLPKKILKENNITIYY